MTENFLMTKVAAKDGYWGSICLVTFTASNCPAHVQLCVQAEDKFFGCRKAGAGPAQGTQLVTFVRTLTPRKGMRFNGSSSYCRLSAFLAVLPPAENFFYHPIPTSPYNIATVKLEAELDYFGCLSNAAWLQRPRCPLGFRAF